MIIVDTRQQAGKHAKKEADFARLGVQTVRSKLIVGDYARLDNLTVAVDTKKDFVELAGNICGGQHERFRAECELARKCGIRLVVLVEEMPPRGDLALWQSPKTKAGKPLTQVKGATLKKAMATMSERYGVEFMTTTKEGAASAIIEILQEEVAR